MKRLILSALICLSFTLMSNTVYSSGLILKGAVLGVIDVKYDIAMVLEDGTLETVKSSSTFKFFKIELELGREYQITFHKYSTEKTLNVITACSGIFKVDVDFSNENCAELHYDHNKRRYELTVYKKESLAQTRLK